MTYADFLLLVNRTYEENRNTLRFGQVIYNTLAEHRQDIADQLRKTDLDPYYHKSVDDKIWLFICERW